MPAGPGQATHFDKTHDNVLPIQSLGTPANFSNGNTTPHKSSRTGRGREYKAFVPSMFLITADDRVANVLGSLRNLDQAFHDRLGKDATEPIQFLPSGTEE